MIVFWILFLLIILISGVLAFLSMKDFRQEPKELSSDNGLFLIRKPFALSLELFDLLHQNCQKLGLIISLERLFKGGESALVLFGPKIVLSALASSLDLIELEDYSQGEVGILGWEIGIVGNIHIQRTSLFLDFPKLLQGEQVWYQIVLQAQKGRAKQFIAQIRVIVVISDDNRRKEISKLLQARKGPWIKIPQKFSSLQIVNFYQKRNIVGRPHVKLTGEEIVKLWSLPKN